ncbi:hypothetical protein IQ247_20795 [Plectonema cf. radiosum LEGE 06105]|uniref:Uncharacterized protein n=1 Tax=Plectonema cf. radiosum LEGE 06105 TaxID=945769 RepID=A0A8J7F4M1_9CYAN|nr:hypothetical protein [Plectonema radiosum]MBE9215072.1 hypothetical protein [Plectonema cf. radiosum LEGE 06105]
MRNINSKFKTWLGITISAFLLLIVICLGMAGLFLLLRVPSFEIGEGYFWVLRWKNNTDGSGISFNIFSLMIIACFMGLLGLQVKRI